jgi:predicted N-acetyltransferase YhbS
MRAERHATSLIAAEAGNYFTPGVASSTPAAFAFFGSCGYGESSRSVDLTAELDANPLIDDGALSHVERASDSSRAELLDFIEREFGKIWRFEVTRAFRSERPTVFLSRHGGAIAGFSAHDANNHGLATFGPAGVDPSLRRSGIGRKLLLASLADLRLAGYRRATISWAAHLDFYANACGAKPSAEFSILTRSLA